VFAQANLKGAADADVKIKQEMHGDPVNDEQ
jgi:hypothetical protein